MTRRVRRPGHPLRLLGCHLIGHKEEIAYVQGITADVTQVALPPVADTTQKDFRPVRRTGPSSRFWSSAPSPFSRPVSP
ncbi:hypothetical protein [Amycolatopsis thermophila]|uniref:Uncharacterized protein n=1 Tax=Amycolatopsis thermophila TaxID=206084 RepID=A0ABU0EUB2_9PSEU|nr:hypothetical protein [Amycolatopsis thermophila]MDQ0378868.1 hypothetical protein [Amycolatopsis thermophila]